MANRLTMAKIRAILSLHQQNWPNRRIAREPDVDRETVAKYVRAASCASKPAKTPIGSDGSKPAKALIGTEANPGSADLAESTAGVAADIDALTMAAAVEPYNNQDC